jgi:hypothetical protein
VSCSTHTRDAILTSFQTIMAIDGDCEPGDCRINYSRADLQDIQRREDRVYAALAHLQTNIETLKSLRSFYNGLDDQVLLPLNKPCGASMLAFTSQLQDYVADLRLLSERANSLVTKIARRKGLILQHFQSQTVEEMSGLAKAAQKETVAMRIIAFVTVLYLPATFVSVR